MNATHYWKIGLFVVAGVLVGLAALIWLGSTQLRNVIPAVAYFDESVQGLETGSEVKVRGVTVGTVDRIALAPDRRHIKVNCSIFIDSSGEGLEIHKDPNSTLLWPVELRVRIASAGITGSKFLQVDFVDPVGMPAPPLPFLPEPNYIPSMPSTLKAIEDPLVSAIEQLPRTLEELGEALRFTTTTLREMQLPELSQQIRTASTTIDQAVRELDLKTIGASVQHALLEGDATLASARSWIDELRAPQGAVARLTDALEKSLALLDQELKAAALPATTEAFRSTAAEVADGAGNFNGTMIEAQRLAARVESELETLRDALRTLSSLADLLERDPGALIRGRSGQGHDSGEGRDGANR